MKREFPRHTSSPIIKGPVQHNLTNCPACGATLITFAQSERTNVASWIMLIAGIFLAPVLIGIVLIIAAISSGFTITTPSYLDCPNCPWNSRVYSWEPVSEAEGVNRYLPEQAKSYKTLTYVAIVLGILLLVACVFIAVID